MAVDRTVRSLSALSGASSSRVLNLVAIGQAQVENEAHREKRLFESNILNNSIILKHRLRSDEFELFPKRRALATKVIIPFEKADLKVGGRSIFFGQRGFDDAFFDIGHYKTRSEMKRDYEVLRLIDMVPSLDPFILREHLRANDIRPDDCYFDISYSDQQRMYDYAASEIGRLTELALRNGQEHFASTGRMVDALLSNEVDEKLEPLRLTLNLPPGEFREGVFSWRGFIYYKWSLLEFWPTLIKVLQEMKFAEPIGKKDEAGAAYLVACKKAIIRGAQGASEDVRKIIGVYDSAYATLIDKQNPKMFRDFLLSAPKMFLEIGEKLGAISHITSFWRYRFPEHESRAADMEELTAIFQDFARSFGIEIPSVK